MGEAGAGETLPWGGEGDGDGGGEGGWATLHHIEGLSGSRASEVILEPRSFLASFKYPHTEGNRRQVQFFSHPACLHVRRLVLMCLATWRRAAG